jgi:wyosine [tRNA(Phe)-imidazoG37] synthetase (radical SAM superfamily)
VALLTNGTLLYQSDVRAQLLGADLVVASLDAASDTVFSRINRPHPGLNASRMIEGLAVFREQFAESFWVEIFIVPGLNDDKRELKRIKEALTIIKPDRIQLNTLDRPGTESWVEPADEAKLNNIAEYLDNAEVIRYVHPGKKKWTQMDGRQRALLSTIKRRPCTAEDVAQVLGLQVCEVNPYLESLLIERKIVRKIMPRGVFYSAGP